MPDCLLHPQVPAAGSCEYCGQPHCGACLQPLLGRVYCPTCYGQVQQLASGKPGAVRTTSPPLQVAAVLAPGPGAPPPAPTPQPPLPGWVSALLYLVLFVVLEFGLQTVFAVGVALLSVTGLGSVDLTHPTRKGMGLWSLLMSFFGWGTLLVVLGFTAGLSHWWERKNVLDLGLRPRRGLWRDALIGLALAGVFFVSVVGVGLARGWYQVRAADVGGALAVTLAGLLILLPFAAVEEISMRGFVLQAISRSAGRWPAVIASSVAFALLHALNPDFWSSPLAIPGLILAGIYLASAYLITGNLWLAIFLHTGWNLMEGPVFGLNVSGMDIPVSILKTADTGPKLWTGGGFGPEGGLLLCLLMAVHIAALWAMRPWLARSEAGGGVEVEG